MLLFVLFLLKHNSDQSSIGRICCTCVACNEGERIVLVSGRRKGKLIRPCTAIIVPARDQDSDVGDCGASVGGPGWLTKVHINCLIYNHLQPVSCPF